MFNDLNPIAITSAKRVITNTGAVIMGNKNIVKYLVRKGAYVNRKNNQEKTPIDVAEDLFRQIPEFDRNIVEILYSPRSKRAN